MIWTENNILILNIKYLNLGITYTQKFPQFSKLVCVCVYQDMLDISRYLDISEKFTLYYLFTKISSFI